MKTNRIFLAGGLAAVAAAGCGRLEPEPDRRMNILYIMTDDHTAQMMSCYDRRYASTPNLDRIAAEGVRFTNSFVANSLSGPSRACMLTGKHSHANGYTDNTLCPAFDASQQTFPKLLQEAGYETAVIGKWHLGSLPTGFDHWEIVPGQGDYYNPDFIRQTGDTVRVHGYLTNLITDRSIEWLEQGRDPENPLPARAPQGAAPQLDGRHVQPGPLRGPNLPAARDLFRRLCGALRPPRHRRCRSLRTWTWTRSTTSRCSRRGIPAG